MDSQQPLNLQRYLHIFFILLFFSSINTQAQFTRRGYTFKDSTEKLNELKTLNAGIAQSGFKTISINCNKINRGGNNNFVVAQQVQHSTIKKEIVSATNSISCADTSSSILLDKPFTNQYPGFLAKTKDGNILITDGSQNYTMTSLFKADLIKCTEAGDVIWAKEIDAGDAADCYYYRSFEASDLSIYVVGYYVPMGGDYEMFISKLDKDGNVLWSKTFQTSIAGMNDHTMSCYQITEDGNNDIYFTGTIGNSKAAILKTDKNGTVLWSKAVQTTNSTVGYGVSFSGDNLLLFGKIDYGYFNDATIIVTMKRSTGAIINQKVYAPVNAAGEYNTWANFAYVTALDNGNVALAGTLFNDGFLNSDGTTGYVGMTEFSPDGSFIKGYKIKGNFKTNGYDTKITVHKDGSADYSFLNYDAQFNLVTFYGNFKEGQLLKERVIHSLPYGASPSRNFLKLSDGGSVTVLQFLENQQHGKIELLRLHNSDTSGTCVGRDTSLAKVVPLKYSSVNNFSLTEDTDVFAQTSNATFTETDEVLKKSFNCVQKSFCNSLKLRASADSICIGTPVTITYTKNVECGSKIFWMLDSSALSISSINNDSTLFLNYNKGWRGYVRGILSGCSVVEDSVLITVFASPGKFNLGKDTILCSGENYLLNAKSGYASYKWQDGSTDSVLEITSPGKYYVTVSDFCGNNQSDTINISAAQKVVFNFLPLYEKCNADTIAVSALSSLNNYSFQPANEISYNNGNIYAWCSSSENYFIQAATAEGCIVSDSLKVKVNTSTLFSLGKDTAICEGNSVNLKAPEGFVNYFWSDGSSANSFNVNASGIYWLTAIDNNQCASSDTINITVNKLPKINLGSDVKICHDTYYTINAGNGFSSYLWQDGSAKSTYSTNQLGTYWVTVTDNNGCSYADTLIIAGYKNLPANFLNTSDSLCKYETKEITAKGNWNSYLWSNSSTQQFITVTEPGLYWLTVSNGEGCYSTDTIQIFEKNCITGIYFPTAFTPNHDGRNDVFKPIVHVPLDKYYFAIYNRFGQKVFETTDLNKGWDGTVGSVVQDRGTTFIWFCIYKIAGEAEKKEKGTVVLVK